MNYGYICICGWIGAKPTKKTIKKIPYNICPSCSKVVKEFVKPLNERVGRCNLCGNASFELSIKNHYLYRTCKCCGTILNIDTKEVTNIGNMESGKRL